jgi:AraC-like DNA-binding protein
MEARAGLAEQHSEIAGYVRSVITIGVCCVPVCPQYQTAVVHVPTHVREVAAKLHRVEQQLRQKHPGKDPTLDEIAAAAGVSLTQAQRALQATGGALQVRAGPDFPASRHFLLFWLVRILRDPDEEELSVKLHFSAERPRH